MRQTIWKSVGFVFQNIFFLCNICFDYGFFLYDDISKRNNHNVICVFSLFKRLRQIQLRVII